MKFPGYWVSVSEGKVCLEKATFDETDLDPATNWQQAWQNQDDDARVKGYVDLAPALIMAGTWLASASGRDLTSTDWIRVGDFEPDWQGNRCEIKALVQLLA